MRSISDVATEPERPKAVEATQRALQTIEAKNADLRAIITVMSESALAKARVCDAASRDGVSFGVLHGMPIVLKDNIDTAGTLTTSGSRFFEHTVPTTDATVVERLSRAGAIIVGKANLHEFALGGTTQNPHFGGCRNPWDHDRVPGGSSGGSAVAVAAGMCVGALGTDTGSSVRMPAALTGVTGLRPTLGRVPNRGTMPNSLGFDTVGPMARRAVDVARIFAAIAGYDDDDETSVEHPLTDVLSASERGASEIRVGVPRSFYFEEADAEVARAVHDALEDLERSGATIVDIDAPADAPHIVESMMLVCLADAADFHRSRLEQSPETFGRAVLERLQQASTTRAIDYAGALRRRARWIRQVSRVFADVDVVVSPTVPIPAPTIADAEGLGAVTRTLATLCLGWAFAGVPALTVPCGFTSGGLPIGMQFAARWWREDTVLRLAAAYQEKTRWHLAEPEVATGR